MISKIMPLRNTDQEKNQREDELALLSAKRIRLENEVDRNIGPISEIAVRDYIKGRFYDAGFIQKISDQMTIDFFMPKDPQKTKKFVRSVFQDMKRVGVESLEGYVLAGKFGNAKDILIIKGPQNPEFDNLLHEWFIGEMATNNLRDTVPNFAYVYTALRCTPAVIKDKKLIDWCEIYANPEDEVHYVIYENIFQDAKEMAKICKTCTMKQFLSYFIQLLFALQLAANRYRFTHYDLHSENVLCRKIEEDGYIPYPNRNGSISYVWTDCVPTIIDYGRSHVKVGGRHYGFFGMEDHGIYHNKARPFYDIFKFLGFCLDDMRVAKNETFYQAIELYRFFFGDNMNGKQLIDFVIDGRNTYYNWDTMIKDSEKDLDVQDYIEWIRDVFPTVNDIVTEKVPKNTRVYSCEIDFCPIPSNTLKNLKGKTRMNNSSKMNINPMSYQKSIEGLTRRKNKYGRENITLDNDLNTLLSTSKEYAKIALKSLRKDLGKTTNILNNKLKNVIDVNETVVDDGVDSLVNLKKKYGEYYSIIDTIKEYADRKTLIDYYSNLNDGDKELSYSIDDDNIYRLQENLNKLTSLVQSINVPEEYKAYKMILS